MRDSMVKLGEEGKSPGRGLGEMAMGQGRLIQWERMKIPDERVSGGGVPVSCLQQEGC